MIIHDMPLADAQQYLRELHSFYSAGWLKLWGNNAPYFLNRS